MDEQTRYYCEVCDRAIEIKSKNKNFKNLPLFSKNSNIN